MYEKKVRSFVLFVLLSCSEADKHFSVLVYLPVN